MSSSTIGVTSTGADDLGALNRAIFLLPSVCTLIGRVQFMPTVKKHHWRARAQRRSSNFKFQLALFAPQQSNPKTILSPSHILTPPTFDGCQGLSRLDLRTFDGPFTLGQLYTGAFPCAEQT